MKPKTPYLIFIVLLVVANITVAILGGFFIYNEWNDTPATSVNNTVVVDDNTEDTAEPEEPAAQTATYRSEKLKVEFTYPSDWKITESDSSNGIDIDSRLFSFDKVYDAWLGSDTFEKRTASVRGVFKLEINGRAEFEWIMSGDEAIADAQKVTFEKPLFDRNDTFLAVSGRDTDKFFSLAMTEGKELAKGSSTTNGYLVKSQDLKLPVIVTGGFWDIDALRQEPSYDTVSLETFNNSNEVKEAIEIIKSLHSI